MNLSPKLITIRALVGTYSVNQSTKRKHTIAPLPESRDKERSIVN